MGKTRALRKTARCYPERTDRKPARVLDARVLGDGLRAGAVAGLLSGAPSTFDALRRGTDPLAAARAAGNLLLPAGSGPGDEEAVCQLFAPRRTGVDQQGSSASTT